MGSNCSYIQQVSERSDTIPRQAISLHQVDLKLKHDSLVEASQLTQMEIPNAMLHSPTKPSVPFQNQFKSMVRVPSEESLFQNQFSQMKESTQLQKHLSQSQNNKPTIKSSLKSKSQYQQAESPQFKSSSPKKRFIDKNHSHSPIQNPPKRDHKRKKGRDNTNSPKKSQKNQEYSSRRKYSDLPEKKEPYPISRRKISDIRDDHSYIIGMESYSPTKLRTFTPGSILKRRDSDCETNSPQKKQVRFRDQSAKCFTKN